MTKAVIRWFRRLRFRRGAPDPDAFLVDLRRAGLGRSYTQGDRFRDFCAVFHGHSTPEQGRRVLWQLLDLKAGRRAQHDFCAVFHGHSTPEQGRRVLWQLLDWARIYRPVKANDPYETYFRDGERNMGLRIIRTMHAEPAAAVTVQREKGT